MIFFKVGKGKVKELNQVDEKVKAIKTEEELLLEESKRVVSYIKEKAKGLSVGEQLVLYSNINKKYGDRMVKMLVGNNELKAMNDKYYKNLDLIYLGAGLGNKECIEALTVVLADEINDTIKIMLD
ncbi:MAG: hypothetical protein E6176_10745 [Clostridium celatum]|nr:hypothetical protein [Clostridium celatum]